jgi:hypothetical protein
MRLKAFLALIGAACVVGAIASGASGAIGRSQCQTGSGPGGPGGVVIKLQGSSKFCSAAVIQAAEDVTSPTPYTVCGPLGKACHTVTVNAGISIKRLLHIAGIPRVQLAEVIPPRGSPSILQSGGFEGGFVVLDPPLGYVGPAGTSGNLEAINSPGSGPIDIYAYTRRLDVTVASTGGSGTYRPGTRVQFSASPASGPGVHYIWSSPAGKMITSTDSITLTVNGQGAGGNFDVYVTVVGPDGAGVSPTPAQITVHGIPSPGSVNPPGSGNGKKSNPSTGNQPSSGGSGLTGGSGNTSTPPTTTYPTYANPTYANPPTTNNSGQPGHTTTRHRRTAVFPGTGQKVVQGRLISTLTPVTPSALASGNGGAVITTSQQRDALSPPLVERALPPAAGLAAAGAILLLLGSGAGRELRSVRRSIASSRLA